LSAATIYGFEIETSTEQDEALILKFNSSPNRSHFHLLTRKCADFVKDVINLYQPKALHRNVADLGISIPKQMAKRLVQFSASHPKLRLSRFIIPQVPGDIARSKALARCVPKDALKRRPSSRDARERAVCGHWDDPWALLTR
jgi:hypothetical protein